MSNLDLSPEEYLRKVGERLGLFSGPDFLALPLPERKPILGPWLVEQSLTMLCAEAGLGKTRFLLGMALAVAKGEPFLDYPATSPQPVLYIDGEMSPRELQDRLHSLGNGDVPGNFYAVSGPSAFDPWLDLNEDFARFQVDEIITKLKPKVLILDNKSTLMSPKKENDAESWVEVQRWFIKLRERGLAVVLVHHTGKNGLQRGSSMHEVVLDTSIMLKKPLDGITPAEGLRFVLTFPKHRHFYGKDAEARVVTLSNLSGQSVWTAEAVPEANQKAQQARDLATSGMSQREIAEELGVSVGSVNTTVYVSKGIGKGRRGTGGHHTTADINAWIASQGVRLEEAWKEGGLKHQLVCLEPTCGHQWQAFGVNVVYRGGGCPKCRPPFSAYKLTKEEVVARLTPRGIQLLGEWHGQMKDNTFRCTLEHEWTVLGIGPLQGSGCPECARLRQKNRFAYG